MIPRYQKVLFAVFAVATLLMAVELLRLRRAAAERLQAGMADAPLVNATQMPMAPVKLLLASDVDDQLRMVEQQMAAPVQVNARARFVLQALFRQYASRQSPHRLPNGSAVEDVFLLPIENAELAATDLDGSDSKRPSAVVAVVNLDHAFFAQHPSGLATEMLTVRSMVGTLHANLQQVVAVRFLVDGEPAQTLAGHADLQHVYSATEERDIQTDAELADSMGKANQ